MPRFDLEHIFTYHAVESTEQVEQYKRIRDAAKEFAAVVLENTPPGADSSACVRKIREVVMTANASIALGGRLFEEKNKPENKSAKILPFVENKKTLDELLGGDNY